MRTPGISQGYIVHVTVGSSETTSQCSGVDSRCEDYSQALVLSLSIMEDTDVETNSTSESEVVHVDDLAFKPRAGRGGR